MGGELGHFEEALEAGGIAWWMMQLPSGVVFFSDYKVKVLGYKPKDFVHYTNFTDLLHKDDHAKAMKAMKDHIDGKSELYEVKYRIKAKDGSYKIFYDRGKITAKDKKGNITISGIVINLTDHSFEHGIKK